MIIGINGYAGSGKDTVGKLIQIAACKEIPEGNHIQDLIDDYYPHHQWWLEERSGWEIKKWAGKLKYIASILTGIPIEKFEDQEFKKTYLAPMWDSYGIVRKGSITGRQVAVQPAPHAKDSVWMTTPGNEEIHNQMTVREFLQRLGTDALRNGLHENTWVNALMADYKCVPADRAPGGWDCDNWIITDTRFPNEAQAIKDAGGIVVRIDRPGVTAVNAHPSETALDNWDFDHKIMNGSDMTSLLFSVGNLLRKHNLI